MAMKLIPTDYTKHIKAVVKATTEPPRSNGECRCQTRTSILDPPKIPPGATKEELKQLLLHLYAFSTFNVCTCQPLSIMHGPALELHIPPDAKSTTHHTPTRVPMHYISRVKADIERDVKLGVIEPVPENEPTTPSHKTTHTYHSHSPSETYRTTNPTNTNCLQKRDGGSTCTHIHTTYIYTKNRTNTSFPGDVGKPKINT